MIKRQVKKMLIGFIVFIGIVIVATVLIKKVKATNKSLIIGDHQSQLIDDFL